LSAGGEERARPGRQELDALLAWAWPDGLPQREAEVLARLPSGSVALAARRLGVLRRWIDPPPAERFASAAEAARSAGVGLHQFYRLVRAWAEKRSIVSLGVRADEPRTRTSTLSSRTRAAADEALDEALTATPGARTGDLLRILDGAGLDPVPSRTTQLRWIAEARRRHPVGRELGRTVVFDSLALDAVDSARRRLRLCLAIDDPTGFVFGRAVATEGVFTIGYRRAAGDALDRLQPGALAGAELAPVAALRIFVDIEDDVGSGTLPPPSPTVEFVEVGRRDLGRTGSRLFGERAGPLRVGAGSPEGPIGHRMGRRSDLPVWSEALEQLVWSYVDERNEEILRRLREATPDASPRGDMYGLVAAFAGMAGIS
jgi:hypothetical protein